MNTTPEEIEYLKTTKFEFFCPVHGSVLIPLGRLWRTTLRCRQCQAVLNRNPPGTIEVVDERPESDENFRKKVEDTFNKEFWREENERVVGVMEKVLKDNMKVQGVIVVEDEREEP